MLRRPPFWICAAVLAGVACLWVPDRDASESDVVLNELLKKERTRQALLSQPVEASAVARDTDAIAPALAEDRQRFIWQLEHFTFELEWKFGKLVKEAIRNHDRDGLLKCFLPDAGGSVPSRENQQVTNRSWWRKYDYRGDTEPVGASGVAEFLVDETDTLSEINKVGLRVLQIMPEAHPNNQYKLEVLLTVAGADPRGPASLTSTHQLIVRFQDDKDIAEGRIVEDWSVKSLSIRGVNRTLFEEVTEIYGLDRLNLRDNWTREPGTPAETYTFQLAVEDFDRDGYLDVAISSLQGDQYLMRSIDGIQFENVTKGMGLPSSRPATTTTFATWIDYDNDDYPDLLTGKTLYQNLGGKGFRRVPAQARLKLNAATMGAVVADFDCDGWLDLYVLNDHGDADGSRIGFVEDDTLSGVENTLWRNRGDGTFEDVTDQAGVGGEARHSFAAAWFHANDDLYPDLYIVNDFGRNCLFINRGDGSFDDMTVEAGVGDFANSMGVATGDLDNDGNAEIYVANMFSKMGRRIISHVCADDYPEGVFRGIEGACAGSHLYRLTGSDVSYEEISEAKSVNQIGWAYAPAFADFDADGLLDIYATSGFISVDRRKPDG